MWKPRKRPCRGPEVQKTPGTASLGQVWPTSSKGQKRDRDTDVERQAGERSEFYSMWNKCFAGVKKRDMLLHSHLGTQLL